MTESLGISMFSNDEDRRSRLSGNAISGLAEFMKELFENAYKHGRFPDSLGGNTPRQLRYLQMRRLQQGGSAELSLADRGHRASPILGEYISQIMSTFASPHGKPFIEVNISDFGLGVLDHYLSKTSGEMRGDDRLSLLIKLLTQDLTSNRLDPNAGLGIQKAMKAARKARAFISVRTAEFWLGQSFTTGEEALGLQPLTDETLPRVVGTHWHFIWGPQR